MLGQLEEIEWIYRQSSRLIIRLNGRGVKKFQTTIFSFEALTVPFEVAIILKGIKGDKFLDRMGPS
jgi:hypothetical protein